MAEEWNGFQRAREGYKEDTRLWDKTLYDLCKKYPKHDQPGAVFAKVGLIDKSYTTGLERHTKGKKRRLGIIVNHKI